MKRQTTQGKRWKCCAPGTLQMTSPPGAFSLWIMTSPQKHQSGVPTRRPRVDVTPAWFLQASRAGCAQARVTLHAAGPQELERAAHKWSAVGSITSDVSCVRAWAQLVVLECVCGEVELLETESLFPRADKRFSSSLRSCDAEKKVFAAQRCPGV